MSIPEVRCLCVLLCPQLTPTARRVLTDALFSGFSVHVCAKMNTKLVCVTVLERRPLTSTRTQTNKHTSVHAGASGQRGEGGRMQGLAVAPGCVYETEKCTVLPSEQDLYLGLIM